MLSLDPLLRQFVPERPLFTFKRAHRVVNGETVKAARTTASTREHCVEIAIIENLCSPQKTLSCLMDTFSIQGTLQIAKP